MKKALLLVILLVMSVSLANAVKPNGPWKPNYNNFIYIGDIEVHVSRSSIWFIFDHPVSNVCVENINTGKSFSGYFTPATCWPDMAFEPGNGTWVIKVDGVYCGRFNIPFATWPDPSDFAPAETWESNPWDNWGGNNTGGFDYGDFNFNHGTNLYPVDWFDDGNGPVYVWFHY